MKGAPCESRSLPAPTAPLRTTNPMSFPCSCHHLHAANPRGLTLPALQSPTYQCAETLATHQSTWPYFFFCKMVWLLYFFSKLFFLFLFFLAQEKPQFRWCQQTGYPWITVCTTVEGNPQVSGVSYQSTTSLWSVLPGLVPHWLRWCKMVKVFPYVELAPVTVWTIEAS